MKISAVNTLRVNIKSLAAESKIIKKEIRKTSNTQIKNELHLHRISKVKTEARAANLALAAVRNIEYNVVESKATKTQPNWNRVKEKFLLHTCGPKNLCSETKRIAMTEFIDRWIMQAKIK